ncbi:MAG: hypothetical protein JW940_08930 [Polyangiaceae bacterium]|nr:hypothetical protein [Polyangiaceae bacterium]
MSRILLALLLSAGVLAARPAGAQVLCKFDAECGLGEACVSGVCAPLAQPSPACTTGRCLPPGQAAGAPATQGDAANAAAEPEPTEEDQRNWERNTTLVALGAVSVGVGVIGLVVGSITKALADDKNTVVCKDTVCRHVNHHDRVVLNTTGWIGLVGGGVLFAGGIPLIIIGWKKHPVDKPRPSPTLEAVIGPAAGRLELRF